MPLLLGHKIKHLRHQYKLTQALLAKELGLSSHSQITKLESGQNTTSPDIVLSIAFFFGVSTDYLLRDTVPLDLSNSVEHKPVADQKTTFQLFGKKLRMLRSKSGLSQKELSEKLSLRSRAYISNLESGRKQPSLELVVIIADWFNVSTDFLLRDDL